MPVFIREDALRHVGGNVVLLKEITALFAETGKESLAEIEIGLTDAPVAKPSQARQVEASRVASAHG